MGPSSDRDEPLLSEGAGRGDQETWIANTLIESMPGILYLYDRQGPLLRWNRNFETVSGYSSAEIARMSPLDFFGAADRARVAERIHEVFEMGESSVEADFIAKNGRAAPYFFTGKRILFDGMTCLIGMGLDIADRKRTEAALDKSEARYRATLDSILEGCQMLAFDWRYIYLNDAAAIHNRRPNDELLGRRMTDVWPGIEATPVFAMLLRCMRERRPLHQEVDFVFPDGARGWFDVRAQPVPEGIFVLSIDISERKQAELALRELNEQLEQKVAERTVDLEAARKRAESADLLKSSFLATMSHELRTPLNSIIGFTGIVLQRLAGPLTDEQTKQLGMVQTSARHLLDLINDILDISKIEAGQVEVRRAPFDLREMIEGLAGTVRPLVDKKALTLEMVFPSALGTMNSDRRRVTQILLNLLNNALKFTDRGGVTLTADIVTEGAGPGQPAARIKVQDTGIGIKDQDLTTLFLPFRQIDQGLQRQHEGTGLGLAICRRLAELLGGTVAAESAWGKGSTFTVTLPLAPPESSP
jgi:PAS domain S-box-containing protein